jgi:hypothetical protein
MMAICRPRSRKALRTLPLYSIGLNSKYSSQSDFPRLAGGTIPFIRKYSTIWP